ncbi:condensation domain-containing protein [Micromonospora sp. NPDC005298]|uniref:condensation domain-containing protein n=1 Tax=Micromonospora sp. NPDC005298 TaxID=3156873 RepID=UPI00339E20CD
MTASRAKTSLGPTSLAEKARLTGAFDDWHNLFYRTIWVTGALDKGAVRDAWRRLCQRHDALRRTYASPDEARTHSDALSEVQFYTAETDERAIELMRDFLGTPFSLDGPAFTRIAIVQRSEQRHLFGIALDHIITDLISWRHIREDFKELYDRALAGDASDLPEAGSYQRFASEQRRCFSSRWGEERREFWRSYSGEFGTYPSPFLPDAKHTGDYQLKVLSHALPPDAKARVHALSRQARVTPFAVVSTGVLAGMREVAGMPAPGISVTHHGRGLPGTAQTAGLFAETVPLHLGHRATSRLAMVQEVFLRTLDIFDHAIPLTVAGSSWNEVFTGTGQEAPGVQFELHEQPMSSFFTAPFSGTEADYIDVGLPNDKIWTETVVIFWNLYDTSPHLVAEYNASYFPEAAVEGLLDAAERFVFSAGT